MTLRRPHEDAVLPAADAAMIREILGACADLIAWAGKNCGPQFAAAAADAAESAGLSRAPGALACHASLAIDYIGFADAAGSTR
jgi:hypothetical protein